MVFSTFVELSSTFAHPTKAIDRRSRYAPEAFRQSRRYANAKRGHSRSVAFWPRPQLPRLCDRTTRKSEVRSQKSAMTYVSEFRNVKDLNA
ncbi:MAG: hypothetical protein F6J94_04705 [Moorea sp. SIO1F2]|uniref:hypothetical protein n=1 Tax=unclassified Moorena TaxID=2683338 RepID=UPI0013BB2701|nr:MULTISPECIES: hypothetical protein [unclassified Moorena]NEN95178.1 hypothetical protein [Moorena sp. SIO3I7]NEO64604.1 hypothetical protein [Moorena sp. SIO4G2]NEO08731.1 hypothetical protein [Moorena sp. SIO3I8]NEO20053.1 hypothetical protein [Moorena sp. SIO4A5]NEP26536.1 hypothetical protein [Moorena sp. SIO3I6]